MHDEILETECTVHPDLSTKMRPSVNHRAAIELNISGSHELFRMDTLKTLQIAVCPQEFMPAAHNSTTRGGRGTEEE